MMNKKSRDHVLSEYRRIHEMARKAAISAGDEAVRILTENGFKARLCGDRQGDSIVHGITIRIEF